MIDKLKRLISLDNPIRLFYHLVRAILANIVYGFPSKGMIIIGVTGTNGKTTTTNIIAKALRQAGKQTFMFSTVNYMIGDDTYTNDYKMTSPDAFTLQRLLKEAKKAGCKYAVIETASHGLLMNRVWGIDYDIAVLTNITQDHLDLHRDMKNYVNTKLSLFKKLISFKRKPNTPKTAIINYDIPSNYRNLFLGETYDSLFTYGKDFQSNLRPTNIESDLYYTKFDLRIPGKTIHIKTRLVGDFNVYNISAAVGTLMALGIETEHIEQGVKNIEAIPGRMEEVDNIEGFKIYIDYAHTPDALSSVLGILSGIEGRGRLITIFGATGDRDKTKRPIMGKIVSDNSDVVILTQDDDYSENTMDIIKDVVPGIGRKEGNNFWIIPDRKEAIRTALIMAKRNDIILLAGKGDEHVMVTNRGAVKWNDREVVLEILKDIDDNKIIN